MWLSRFHDANGNDKMIATLEHPIPAVLTRRATRGIAVLQLLPLVVGATLYGATWIQLRAEATRPSIVTQFGPLPSHNGALRGRVVDYPSRFVIGNDQRWVVRLESRDGSPLENARLGVTVHMPETGDRRRSPVAQPTGAPGEYALAGIRFDRPGWWNVALTIRYDAGEDSLAFNVSIK
jgi:hypothetical protein